MINKIEKLKAEIITTWAEKNLWLAGNRMNDDFKTAKTISDKIDEIIDVINGIQRQID